jgi:transposase, IS5 family
VLRTVSDQPTLWDAILPSELLVVPAELGRVDALLDDPVFFAPFAAHFDARIGRPSIPMETYLRLMFLKFRYRLGYEVLCREVADSISWQRFGRIPLGTRVPHPTTLMKISTRCGDDAVAALNEALLVKAAAGKLLRTDKVRADTTVVAADVGYPTDSGLLAQAVGTICRTVARIKGAGAATRTPARDRRRSAGRRARAIASKLRLRGAQQRDQAQAAVRRITGELAGIADTAAREATAVLRTARRALRRASGPRKGRLQQAINHLDTMVQRTQRVVTQPRSRLARVMPESATRLVSLHDADARPIRKGTAGQARRVRLQGAGRRQRRWCHPRPHGRDRKPGRRTAIGAGDPTDHPPHGPSTPGGDRRPRLRLCNGRTRPTRPRGAQCGDPPRE